MTVSDQKSEAATWFPDRNLYDAYAPNFRVLVDGVELDPKTKGDILDIKVTLELEKTSGFDFTLNNWDDLTESGNIISRFADVKNLAAEGVGLLGSSVGLHFGRNSSEQNRFKYSENGQVAPGRSVQIWIGYGNELTLLINGIITSLTPKFPESGAPTIGVSGQDRMILLRDNKPGKHDQKSFKEMSDAQIVEQIATKFGLRTEITKTGLLKYTEVVQRNQDFAQFIMERAKRLDYECYISPDPKDGQDVLKFKKPTDGRSSNEAVAMAFVWGRNLIEFTPTMSISHQVSQVTVRSWDSRTKKSIEYTATSNDLPSIANHGDNGPDIAKNKLQKKSETVVEMQVLSTEEARNLAISILRERAYQYLTASGRVIGTPSLRPGLNIEISGIGARFSGSYNVTKVEHSMGSSGFFTHFDVKRIFAGKQPEDKSSGRSKSSTTRKSKP